MISILSGVVLMLAIGTLVQRQDLVADFFGSGSDEDDVAALVRDEVSVAPDTLTRIDVLDNDSGLPADAADRLAVLGQPGCGRVFVQAGALQFLAESDCEATQSISYSIEGTELGEGEVVVQVVGATGTRNAPEPRTGVGIVLSRPTGNSAGSAPSGPTVAVAPNTAPARPLPTITLPGASTQPKSPEPKETTVAAAPKPSAPGTSRPAAPTVSRAPGAPSLPGLVAPQVPSDSIGSGLALADTSPSIGGSSGAGIVSQPSRPGSGSPSRSPSAPGQLAGLSAPTAPGAGLGSGSPSISAPSVPAPSIPGRPSIGGGSGPTLALAQPSRPSQPGVARPSQPGVATPSQPSAPSTGRPAAPSAPSTRGPAAPAAPGGTAVAAIGSDPSSRALPGGLTNGVLTRVPQSTSPVVARDSGRNGGGALPGGTAVAPAPSAIGRQATPTLALARVEVPGQIAAPSASQADTLELAETGDASSALNPGLSVGSVATGGAAVAFAEPTEALREIMDLRDTMSAVPLIDTAGPDTLAQPDEVGADRDLRLSAIDPASIAAPITGREVDTPKPEVTEAPEQIDVARLPSTELACVVPPSITLDVRAAGETDLMITSPCHADSVAELTYLKMKFGVKIDRTGRGEIIMFGFETSAEAELAFADGETLEFSVPFTAVERVERVALAWDAPILLGLHALEFGTEREGQGHVSVNQPRDFRTVRRRGGGYLHSFAPVEGVGQNVQIYSHWIRRGGKSGVVKMYVDFTSRFRDRLPST
ncbi:MAG: hypothetical protein AAF565_10785, partial [Pseudomonadota bacterium]